VVRVDVVRSRGVVPIYPSVVVDRNTPGAQSAAALLRAGLRRRHVEATLVQELGFSDDEARAVVERVLKVL
jgi:hypothetical protein